MKKTILILSILILVLSLNKNEKYVIPKDSIRFRVIANSNNYNDQELKKEVVNNLKSNLNKNNFTSLTSSRDYLKENLPSFKNIIEKSTNDYKINYGSNFFPEKEYDDVTYKEGEYESLVVTLGSGEGNNFWCVLFPPLCFDDEKPHEYKSFIKEIFDKIFE